MKMPEIIKNEYFAPCGFNCLLCEKHLKMIMLVQVVELVILVKVKVV